MWDESFDLVVIGTGAAGMAATIRAHDLGSSVLLIEKTGEYGGSTAISGGVCWIGNNPHMPKGSVSDNREAVATYLNHITEGEVPQARIDAYIDDSLRMMSYMEKNTHLRWVSMSRYTDYYPEAPGGRAGGRSMECPPFDACLLGDEFNRLRRPHPQSQIMGKFGITAAQAQSLLISSWKTKFTMLWGFFLFFLRSFKRKRRGYNRDTRLTAGNSLMGRMRRSLMDRDVPLWLNTEATSLVSENGRVLGLVAERDGETIRIQAHQGVLLAAGGFERNKAMREQYQRHPISDEWCAGHLANTGDGIRMGIDVGADLALMKEAWWTPVTLVPREELAWVLVVEKSLPHGFMVNAAGKRFTNEAAPYIDVVIGMYEDDDENGNTIPCHLIFDSRFRKNYPCGPVPPGYAVPDSRLSRRYKNGFLMKADSIEKLAELIGVPVEGLTQTVERFNDMARAGKDREFGRGESASDRYYGDPRVTPNPCLGTVEKAPFYAIKVYPGDLGTKGGLVVDEKSRVLTPSGEPILGLYAAGNCSAAVMGRTYPGAGGTIGPALTFGFIASEAALADAESSVGGAINLTNNDETPLATADAAAAS